MEGTLLADKWIEPENNPTFPTLVRSNCELPSRDSASETRNLAGGPPAQIMEFQIKEDGDEYYKSPIFYALERREILEAEEVEMNMQLEKLEEKLEKMKAKSRRHRIENAEKEELEAKKRKLEELKAAYRRMKEESGRVEELIDEVPRGEETSSSEPEKVHAHVENFLEELDANVKSQVDYSNFIF